MKKIYFLILLAFTVSHAQKPDCIPDLFYQGGMHMADYYMTSCFFPNLTATNTIDIDVDGNFVKSPLLSLTTTGSGAATYNTTTRVLNVPTGLFSEVDGSTSNELQNLTFNAATRSLSISSGNSVTVPGVSTPYSGTTSAAGTYTVTFPVAYSVAPNIQANIIGGTDTQNIRTTAVSTTGFTVLVRNRTDVVGLLPTWANVNGAAVDILVTAK